jgi:hypothetical protein
LQAIGAGRTGAGQDAGRCALTSGAASLGGYRSPRGNALLAVQGMILPAGCAVGSSPAARRFGCAGSARSARGPARALLMLRINLIPD